MPKISSIKDEICWLGCGLCFELASDIDTGEFDGDLDCEVSRLNGIALYLGYTLQECVQIAYNDIKDRKGIMHNGVFIKESDPAYQEALVKLGKA